VEVLGVLLGDGRDAFVRLDQRVHQVLVHIQK
jgi:hypothetical protein